MVELNRRTFLSGSVPQNGMKRLMSSLLVLVLQALLQLLKPRRLVLL